MVSELSFRGRRDLIAFSVLSVILGSGIPEIVSAEVRDEAYMSIQVADEAVSSAFEAVLIAEDAGANVSTLILRLNKSASLLAEAKNLFRTDDYVEAAALADHIVELAHNVEDEASTLGGLASSERESFLKLSLISSIIGISAFLFFMLILWRRFKRAYIQKSLKLRPEVASHAQT